MKILRSLILLTGLVSLSANAQITVFPECGFLGDATVLPVGNYTRADLRRMGISDNDISSVIVAKGYSVTFFDRDGFRGTSSQIEDVARCLADDNFDDRVSSLSITATGQTLDSGEVVEAGADEPGIELFSDCNYRGRSVKLTGGEYSAADLRRLGMSDNSISSARVPDGFTLELYLNDFQRGASGKLNTDNKCLVDRFNDVVSSVVVSGQPKAAPPVASGPLVAIVYSECNYRGQTAELRVGEFTANALAALGMPDNAISSVRLVEGAEVQLFQNDFFRGISTGVTANVACMAGDRFDDNVSSIKVLSASGGAEVSQEMDNDLDGVDIYAECRFRGQAATLPAGEYTARDLARLGFRDNSISSIKVPEGYTATGFENDFYRGGSVAISNDESCLDTRRADNAISSMKVEQSQLTTEPVINTLNSRQRRELNEGLACVGRYVDRNLCNAKSWDVIVDFCSIGNIPLMDDGYLEGHVNQGNCTERNWKELVKRITDPAER